MIGERLFIDFETRSRVDLSKRGLGPYCADSSTDFWCMAWVFTDNKNEFLECGMVENTGQPTHLPHTVREHVLDGGEVVAHNAPFEWHIWNLVCRKKHGWPKLTWDQLTCTMAQCLAMNLPASLEKAAAALGLNHQKDMAGHRVMLQFCKPDSRTSEFIDPKANKEKYQTLLRYCEKDLLVEIELAKRLLKLQPFERELWELDQEINQTGVRVDVPALAKTLDFVEKEKKALDLAMQKVTSGYVGTCNSVVTLAKWLRDFGLPVEGVGKAEVIDALDVDGLPSECKQALLLRKDASKSSTAKIEAMLNKADLDGRVRNTLQYCGASTTGRWSGRGIQLQNFPRGEHGIGENDIDFFFEVLNERNKSS